MAGHVPKETIPEKQPPVVKIEQPVKKVQLTRVQKRELLNKEIQKNKLLNDYNK